MKPSSSRNASKSAERTTPRKLFKIEKLEERIAPKKGGNGTNNCGGGSSNAASSGWSGSGSNY